MDWQRSSRGSAEEQVESQLAPGLVPDSGCRSLIVVAGVSALLVGVFFMAVAGWVFERYSHDSSGEGEGESKPQRIERGPGEHVDGLLAFQIEESRCGVDAVGVPPDRYEADGQYCVYLIRVRNVGGQPRVLLSTPQHAIGSDGNEYEPDLLASEAAGPGLNSFPDLLWQDQETTVALVFELDPAVSIVALELHDSPWSDGVQVDL